MQKTTTPKIVDTVGIINSQYQMPKTQKTLKTLRNIHLKYSKDVAERHNNQ